MFNSWIWVFSIFLNKEDIAIKKNYMIKFYNNLHVIHYSTYIKIRKHLT